MTRKVFVTLLTVSISSLNAFSFRNYIRLKKNDTYVLFSKAKGEEPKNVGYGKVLQLSATKLHLYFEIIVPFGKKNAGHLDLRYIKQKGKNYIIKLKGYDQMFVQIFQDVLVDKFIANNGILTFNIDGSQKIFFQMTKRNNKYTQIITNYGRVLLKKN